MGSYGNTMAMANTEPRKMYPSERVLFYLLSSKDHETIVLGNSTARRPKAGHKWHEVKRGFL